MPWHRGRLADRGSSSIAVLCGPGGVGKSALARTWGQQVGHRFPDGQLYADLGGFGGGEPADPGEVLGMFLRALGVPAPEVPSALAEQTKLYRSLTALRRARPALQDGAYRSLRAAPD